MKDSNFLIYGASGYTGKLISELAVSMGLKPILAGRSQERIAQLASQLKCEARSAEITDHNALVQILEGNALVINCAGPFSRTAQPMTAACQQTGTHYLDITGELEVFEYCKALGERAEKSGIMLLPGVGFDVVPSDCMAMYLKSRLPKATHLDLALRSKGGGISHGTMTTMIENIHFGGAIRENGKIRQVRHAYKIRECDFGNKTYRGVTIPWGDISTAYTSTSIPNIRVFNCAPPSVIRSMKALRYIGWAMGAKPIQKWIKKRVDRRSAGPDTAQRSRAKSWIWGEARVEVDGRPQQFAKALLEMPDGYTLTALTALLIAQKVLNGHFTTGYQTPSSAYGADLILEVNNMELGGKSGQRRAVRRIDLN